jgi:hypothetical protein
VARYLSVSHLTHFDRAVTLVPAIKQVRRATQTTPPQSLSGDKQVNLPAPPDTNNLRAIRPSAKEGPYS